MNLTLSIFAVLSSSVTAAGRPPSGQQIMARSQKAYDSVRSFEQVTHGVTGKGSSTAHLWFVRPGRLYAEGAVGYGVGVDVKYGLLCNEGKLSVLMGKTWVNQRDPVAALAMESAISFNAIVHLPAMLLHTGWGSFSTVTHGPYKVTSTKVDGADAWVVSAATPKGASYTFDKKTYFLVKTHTEEGRRSFDVTFDKPSVDMPIPVTRFKKSN